MAKKIKVTSAHKLGDLLLKPQIEKLKKEGYKAVIIVGLKVEGKNLTRDAAYFAHGISLTKARELVAIEMLSMNAMDKE